MLRRKTRIMTVKFQPDRLEGVNAISRHEASRLWVNATEWTSSVLVPARGGPQAWPVARLSELTADHFAQLLSLDPELVVFGSGARLRFVAPALLRPLIERGIGVETMDTVAACRTFNVLASEGRAVAAALLIEPAAPSE
jgi:uncharacterized protein